MNKKLMKVQSEVSVVQNCPKCDKEVSEEMAFCPKCGTALKGEQPSDVGKSAQEFGGRMAQKGREFGKRMTARASRRAERMARREEKYESYEKSEIREFAFVGPLIGGLILVFLGLMLYLQVTGSLNVQIVAALFFVVIGIIIILAAIYATTMLRRRYPNP
jgi:hypothetical protein